MKGPFLLTVIESVVAPSRCGVFMLSRDGVSVDFVGRSDDDLYEKIKCKWKCGIAYKYFWYKYCNDSRQGYELECQFYHEYLPQDNLLHPSYDEEGSFHCPVEDCLWYK
jgi:hypothetical protein